MESNTYITQEECNQIHIKHRYFRQGNRLPGWLHLAHSTSSFFPMIDSVLNKMLNRNQPVLGWTELNLSLLRLVLICFILKFWTLTGGFMLVVFLCDAFEDSYVGLFSCNLYVQCNFWLLKIDLFSFQIREKECWRST